MARSAKTKPASSIGEAAGFLCCSWASSCWRSPRPWLLPVLAPAPLGAGLGWRRLWPLCVAPGAAHASPHMDAADAISSHAACGLSGDAFRGLRLSDLRRSLMAQERAPPQPSALCNSAFIAAFTGCAAYYVLGMGTPITLYVTCRRPDSRAPALSGDSFPRRRRLLCR